MSHLLSAFLLGKKGYSIKGKGSGGDTDGRVFGVSWNKGESPTLTRTDSSVGLIANAGVDSGVVVNNFDSIPLWQQIVDVTLDDGYTYVRIPKFYIKKTDGVGSKTWQVSLKNFSGAYLPKCFLNGTTELPYIYVGKYLGTESGGLLQSVSGGYPKVLDTIVNFRTWAVANGAGYQLLDIHVVDVLQTLFYVEFATLNSQAIMAGYTAGQYAAGHVLTADTNPAGNTLVVANATGALYRVGQAISVGTTLGGLERFYGRTITQIQADTPGAGSTTITFDGAAVVLATNDIMHNSGWKNGACSTIAATSGSLVSNSDGKYACKYRGIENPWGNIVQFVDGLNINARQGWVAENAADYASNVFAAPYLQLGYVNGATSGYISAMGWDANRPYAAYPASVAGGAATKYYSDAYFQAAGACIFTISGNWYVGVSGGVSYCFASQASTAALIYIGGRLVKKAV